MGARQVAPLTFLDGNESLDGVTEFGPVITHVEGGEEPVPDAYAATSGSYRQDVLDAEAAAAALPPLEELTHPLDAGPAPTGAQPVSAQPAPPVIGLEDLDDEGPDDFFEAPGPKA